jgi:hypothetical protein
MNRKIIKYLKESALSRIVDHMEKHSCGIITTYRGERTRAENKSNNREALAVLKRKGYGVTKVKGSYIENFGSDTAIEVGEDSFFVVNYKVDGDDGGELENVLRKLGERYDQDSILSIRGKDAVLIGTSKRDNAFPNYGQRVPLGSGKFGRAAYEFLTRIKGRPFAFVPEWIEEPDNVMGKWAMASMADKALKEMNLL